ncbi:MAG: glycosyltransferase family 39 protein, partial [Desulfomonilia bacterium]|nr:glycosyltransferase family 39 protein [Desulfomonilia bacterium]
MVSTLWHARSYELILILVIILFAWLRFGLVDVPLERDEGEYAYAGQLILQGSLPYQDVYTMKLPGVHLMYAGIMAIFGQTHQGIRIGLILINAVVIITLFLLGRRLMGPVAGLTAAGVFAVLSCGQAVQGAFANAEHFV